LNKIQKIGASALTLALLGSLLAGCMSGTKEADKGAGTAPAPAPLKDEALTDTPVMTDPINLTFYKFYVGLTDKEFDQYFVQPLKKKYPNVTLTLVNSGLTGPLSPENILLAGVEPDLIFTSNYSFSIFKNLKLNQNLNSYLEKTKFDLNRFDPAIVESLKKYNDDGIYAIPFSNNLAALFYNKDIFDRFGVEYPKEQSTWDEILALHKKLVKNDGGVQYRGIVPPVAKQFGDQMALSYADNSTKKATLETDQWKKAISLYKQFYEIPGMIEGDKLPTDNKTFFEEQSTAMYTNWADTALANLTKLNDNGTPMNWDMTTYPSFSDAKGIGRRVDFHLMMMSATSKHKDLVFDIMRYMTNETIQLDMTKNARMTALNNEEIKKQYAQAFKIMEGKNLAAALKFKSAGVKPSDFDAPISGVVNKAGYDVANNKTDVNTALRTAQEEANKIIAEETAKK
jgi:multiple sugar transport system substrate-binding protein